MEAHDVVILLSPLHYIPVIYLSPNPRHTDAYLFTVTWEGPEAIEPAHAAPSTSPTDMMKTTSEEPVVNLESEEGSSDDGSEDEYIAEREAKVRPRVRQFG